MSCQSRPLSAASRSSWVYAESVTPVNGHGLVWGPTKTHERRHVPIPEFLVEDLQRLTRGRPEHELVFHGPRGGGVRVRTMTRAGFDKAAVEMGLCQWEASPTAEDPDHPTPIKIFHPHELRHTAASMAIASGADVKVVQTMLGHKDATVTLNHYGHLFTDNLDHVAQAMRKARAKELRGETKPKKARRTSRKSSKADEV